MNILNCKKCNDDVEVENDVIKVTCFNCCVRLGTVGAIQND